MVSIWGTDGKLSWDIQLDNGKYNAQIGAVNGEIVTWSKLEPFEVKGKIISVKFFRNKNVEDNSTVVEDFSYGTSNQKFGYNTDGNGKYNVMTAGNIGYGEWTNPGYKLLGWAEDRNATDALYSTYSPVSDEWINQKSPSINLYAVWRKFESFNIDQTEVVLKSNEQYKIKSDVTELMFLSDNQDVAIVSENGVVTALNTGKAIITVSNTDGYQVSVSVTVESVAENIKGDVNGNNVVNIIDLIIMQKWMMSMPDAEIKDTASADLNEDGKINIIDFCLMKSILIS